MLVGLFISKPLATVTLCIYILPGLLCQDKPLNMAKLILSIRCMLKEQNKNYPLHDRKIYDLQVGNKYNIRIILHVNQLINTKLHNRINSLLYILKSSSFILPRKHCAFIFLFYFVNWPTNAQLIDKLSHSYMFRHYCVIFRELIVVPCQVTQVCQMRLLVIQFQIVAHKFYAVEISMFGTFKILELSYL